MCKPCDGCLKARRSKLNGGFSWGAGPPDQNGNENVSVGNDALQYFGGSYSVAVGGEALSTLRFTGSTNVAVGYQSPVNLGGQDVSGNYAAAGVPFPVGFPAAVDAEIDAQK